MPNSPATQTAAGWLQSGQAPKDRAMEVARALALLSGRVPATASALKNPLAPDVEMALLVQAAQQDRWELVALLGGHAAHKPTTKHAKKLIFAAKQKGIDVPELKPVSRGPVSLSASPDPLPSFASSVDGAGGQLLFLGGWSRDEGPYCVMGMLTDKEGLLSAYYLAPTSKTQQLALLDRLKLQFRGFTAPVPEAYAAGRLRWGLDQRDANKQVFEGDMAEVRRVLAGVEPVGELGIDLDPEEQANLESHLQASRKLSAEPCFAGWMQPSSADLQTFARAIKELEDATETALVTLRDSAFGGWLDTLGPNRLAERLEVTGWLLVQSQRRAQGMQVLACAQALRAGRPWQEIGLLAGLLDRMLSPAHLQRFQQGGAETLTVQP